MRQAAPGRSSVVSFEARSFDRPADHQRAVHARWQDDRLQRDAERIVAGALRRQPGGRSATAARAVERAPALDLEQGRAGRHRGPAVPRSAPLRRHAGAHDHRQLAACRCGRRARGRLVAGRIRDGDRARPRQRARSARVPGRHGAPRSQRLPEQSPRVARRQPRRLRGAPGALRRSRLGQGRRPRREGDDADRGAVRRAGAGLDARRRRPSCSRATPRRRRCCSRWPCRRRAARRPQPVFGVPARFIVFDVATRRAMAGGPRRSVGGRARARARPGDRARPVVDRIDRRARPLRRRRMAVDARRGPRAGPNYGVVLRKTDASQTIRLGEGHAQKLSPDGKWAAAIIAAPAQLVLYPTGPGEAVRDRHRADREPHLGRMVPGWQAAARLRLGGVACRPLLQRRPDGVGAARR